MGNEKERYSRSIGCSSDEPVERCKDKVIIGTHLSEEFEVVVGVQQGSVLSPLLFAIVIDAVTNEINRACDYKCCSPVIWF